MPVIITIQCDVRENEIAELMAVANNLFTGLVGLEKLEGRLTLPLFARKIIYQRRAWIFSQILCQPCGMRAARLSNQQLFNHAQRRNPQ